MPPGHDMNYYFRGKIIKYSIKVLAEKYLKFCLLFKFVLLTEALLSLGKK